MAVAEACKALGNGGGLQLHSAELFGLIYAFADAVTEHGGVEAGSRIDLCTQIAHFGDDPASLSNLSPLVDPKATLGSMALGKNAEIGSG